MYFDSFYWRVSCQLRHGFRLRLLAVLLPIRANFSNRVFPPTPFALQAQSVPDDSITAAQIDSTSVQTRVTGSCAVGNVVRAINADGSVVCEPDADTACSLSACTDLGRATLICNASSVTVNCVGWGGDVWTARSAAEANSWQSVTHGGGLFVAIAATGTNRVEYK